VFATLRFLSKESSGKHKIVSIKKTLIFFFALPVSSGKFGKQFLRFRAAKTFFFGITVFLYQKKNPVAHLGLGRQFCASLKPLGPCFLWFICSRLKKGESRG
jgi:hypothetical protein